MRRVWLPIALGILAAVLVGCAAETGAGTRAVPATVAEEPTQPSRVQIELPTDTPTVVPVAALTESPTPIIIATPPPARARELEPVPPIPTDWIATAESDSVTVYLVEPTTSVTVPPSSSDEGKSGNFSRANLIIENLGATAVRIGNIWLMSDPDCYAVKGRSIGVLMQAFIVADDWLAVSAVPSESVIGMFSERTYFREEQDIWAREHTDEFGYSFDLFPGRWIRIVASRVWSPEMFGECVQISFAVDGNRISMPLPRP